MRSAIMTDYLMDIILSIERFSAALMALSAVLKYAGCRAYIVRLVYDAFHAV